MLTLAILLSFLTAGVTCCIFGLWWLHRLKREATPRAIIKRLRAEIAELITELNGTTDRNIVLLESRIGQLNEVMARACKLQRVLDREKEKTDSVERIYSDLEQMRSTPVPESQPVSIPERINFDSLPARDKVLVLHRRGESSDSIAEKIGLSRGEIELIISLYDRV